MMTRRAFLGRATAASAAPLLGGSVPIDMDSPEQIANMDWQFFADAIGGIQRLVISSENTRNLLDYYERYPFDASNLNSVIENARALKGIALLNEHGISFDDFLTKELSELPNSADQEQLIDALRFRVDMDHHFDPSHFNADTFVDNLWDVNAQAVRRMMDAFKHESGFPLPKGFEKLGQSNISDLSIDDIESVCDSMRSLLSDVAKQTRQSTENSTKEETNPQASEQQVEQFSMELCSINDDVKTQRDQLNAFKAHIIQDFADEVDCGTIRGNQLHIASTNESHIKLISQLAEAYELKEVNQAIERG